MNRLLWETMSNGSRNTVSPDEEVPWTIPSMAPCPCDFTGMT